MPIIGHGDIASVIPDRPDKTFFASGVSNSGETRESEYAREVALLRKQPRGAHLVYFSSLCVFYSQSRYAHHKRQMEFIVKDEFKLYTVVRLGTILWGQNPNTLINHMRAQWMRGEALTIQDTDRYVIDMMEFRHWLALIPPWSAEMNITGQRMSVSEIVRKYVIPAQVLDAEQFAEAWNKFHAH